MNWIQKSTLIVTVALASFNAAFAGTFWVDSSATSSGDGTSVNSPFKTIQEAANVAEAGDTVEIRGGVYRELVIPAHSGSQTSPITYHAYNNEVVTVSGADAIASSWSQHQGNIFKTSLPQPLGLGKDQIFYAGLELVWARWPNTDFHNIFPTDWRENYTAQSEYGSGGFDTTITDEALSDSASQWVGAYIHIASGKAWIHSTGKIKAGSSGNTLAVRLNAIANNVAYAPMSNNRYFLIGSLHALDSEGEWYIDYSTNTLYLWKPFGGQPSSLEIEYKVRKYAFDLENRSDIVVDGINLFGASIKTNSSTRITIENINANYPSHNDLMIDDSGVSISGWSMSTTNTGIELKGTDSQLLNSTIYNSSGNGVTVHGTGHKIIGNTIYNVDTLGTDAAGIYTQNSSQSPATNIEIAYNTIHDSGRSLITHRYVKASSIHHNDLYRAMRITNDGGATNTFGVGNDSRGTVVAFNLVHDITPFGYPGSAGSAMGIYLDNGSANYIVTRNIVWNCDYAFLHNTHSNDQNHLIVNNTFIGDTSAITSWGADADHKNLAGTQFINNLVVGSVTETDPNWNWNSNQSNYHVANTTYLSTVGFVDPNNADFRLQGSSPAIDFGMATGAEAYTLGYTGSAPDAGALEKSLEMFSAGAGAARSFNMHAAELPLLSRISIKSSYFDVLGAEISYHDSDSVNSAATSSYQAARPREPVDATLSGYLGWVNPGEWTEYVVNADIGGNYDLELTGLSQFNSEDSVSVWLGDDPANSSRNYIGNIPGGGTEALLTKVPLNAGRQIIRLVHSGSGYGYGAITLINSQQPFSNVPTPSSASPTTIIAGYYDQGGEGISYHDSSSANQAQGTQWGSMRESEGPDVTASGYLGWIADGEWLEYTVNVPQAGNYQITFNGVATFDTSDAIEILAFDSADAAQPRQLGTAPGGTGGSTATASIYLNAGPQVLHLKFNGGGYGFASFTLTGNVN